MNQVNGLQPGDLAEPAEDEDVDPWLYWGDEAEGEDLDRTNEE